MGAQLYQISNDGRVETDELFEVIDQEDYAANAAEHVESIFLSEHIIEACTWCYLEITAPWSD